MYRYLYHALRRAQTPSGDGDQHVANLKPRSLRRAGDQVLGDLPAKRAGRILDPLGIASPGHAGRGPCVLVAAAADLGDGELHVGGFVNLPTRGQPPKVSTE